MPAPIYIDYVVRGIPEFRRAQRTIADAVTKGERANVATSRAAANSREREYQRLAQQADRWGRQQVRDAERAERAKARAAEKSALAIARIRDRSATMAGQHAAREARETERAEQAKLRAAERTANAMHRIRERSATMAGRFAAQAARADAAARERRVQFGTAVVGAAGAGFRSGLSRAASATQQVAGIAMGLGGGLSLADSVQRGVTASGMAADLVQAGYLPQSENLANRQKRSTKEVLGSARAVAIRTGGTTEDTLKGLQAFVAKSGDLDTGLKVMGRLAELSVATGSSFSDVAGAAGDLMSQLDGVPDKGEAVMAIMRGIAGQGKLGAVEMKDLARQMAKVAASAGAFGGNAVDNILKMGMLAQEARAGGGAASAAMATTSVQGFVNTLKTPARIKAFKAQGIDVFDSQGMLNDPTKIILQSLEKTKGDPEKMKVLFANVMGERAVTSYANAYRKAGGGDAGRAKVESMFKRQLEGSAMTKEDVAKAFTERMGEADKQIAQTRESFDRAVAERLIPKFLELIPVIEKMIPVFIDLSAKAIPAFADLIKTVADFAEKNKDLINGLAAHPVGALIALEITKSFATAALPALLKRLLTAAFGGGGGGGGGVPGLTPGAGMGAPVAAGVAAGIATGAVIYNAGTKYGEGAMKADDLAAKVRAWNRGDHERGVSPEAARAELQAAQKRMDATGVFDQVGNIISSPFSESSSNAYAQYKSDQALIDNQALRDLITALNANTTATNTNSRSTDSGGAGGGATPQGAGNTIRARNPSGVR